MGVDFQRHALAALPPAIARYPLHSRQGGLQGRSRRLRKISSPPVFDLPTVEYVVISHSDYAIPDHKCNTVRAETLRCEHFTFFL
jgi:hypothetical protein